MKTEIVRELLRLLLSAIAAAVVCCSTAPHKAGATASPSPELTVAARGLLDDALEEGEPLQAVVRITSSGAGQVLLAPPSGTWVECVAVELLRADLAQVVARATVTGEPSSPQAMLDETRIAGGLWIFPPEATAKLPLGEYRLRARLTLPGGAGWSGSVESEDVSFTLIAPSNAPERISVRTSARAHIALTQNNAEKAAQVLDEVLARTPDDFDLLCLRAEVALAGGNGLAAMICATRAARLLAPKGIEPPPLQLHSVQQRAMAALSDGATSSAPQAWTWPPQEVLRLPQAELIAHPEMAVPSAAPVAP